MIVLVAEDSEDIRALMKALLKLRGCHVVEAANGAEAVRVAREQKPDLILMDLNMPVLDGITAAEQIRQYPPTGKTPIIAVTAHLLSGARRPYPPGASPASRS